VLAALVQPGDRAPPRVHPLTKEPLQRVGATASAIATVASGSALLATDQPHRRVTPHTPSLVVHPHGAERTNHSMKKTLRAAGAAGLASATLVTGLFGGAGAAQAAPTPDAVASDDARVIGPMASRYAPSDDPRFWIQHAARGLTSSGEMKATYYDTIESADRAADLYSFPNSVGPVSPLSSPDSCLTATNTNAAGSPVRKMVLVRPCNGSKSQQFSWVAPGPHFKTGAALRADLNGLEVGVRYVNGVDFNLHAPGTMAFPNALNFAAAFSGEIDGVDVAARTATISGTTSPNGTVKIDGFGETRADGKGHWTYELTNLKLGTTTVWAYQEKNGSPTGTPIRLDVTLDVAPLTAKPSFPADHEADAVLSGTAHPLAAVEVRDTAGVVVAKAMATLAGTWTTTITAPNAGGDYDLHVKQIVGGESNGDVIVSIGYGAAVDVSAPADGATVPGGPLTMNGKGEGGARVTVTEKGVDGVLGHEAVAADGTWSLKTTALEDREYTLVVSQTGRGGNVTTSEVVINRGQSAIAPITGRVTFPGTVTDDAHVVGTAEPGAQITITEGTSTLAQGKADSQGRYDIALASPGTGEHTLTLTETKGTATKSLDVTTDFGAPVTATGPAAAFPGSSTTITGTGADGAQVVLTEGGTVLGKTVVKDGTWSVDVDRVQDGEHTYSVTQTARGATVSTTDVSVTRDAPVSDVTLTTPTSGSTYPAKTSVRFTGTGTPGAAIALKAHFGLAEYTTTVAYDGTWSIDRPMNTGRYVFDLVQTAKGGHTSHVDGIELIEAGTVIDRPFAVTSPESGSTHKDETVAFTGTGTPGSTITIDPKDPSLQKVTTTVAPNGYWTVNRYLGGGAYDFDVIQNAIGGAETGRLANLRINQPATIDRPFAVTAPGDREEHKAEYVTFRGTGTPRSTITAHVTNFASFDSTVTVATDGTWSFTRWLGTGAYTFEITQTTNGQANGTSTLQLNQPADPVDQPFALTSHEDGDTYTPGSISFTGTGAAGATVTLDPGAGLTKVTTTVQDNGTWKVAKYLGTGPYTFTVTQDDEGTITTLATLHLTAAK